jgi:acyl transferase domain-containing protein/NAD(P)H-dependent flavin oxidoreductase YrpB (nitropropane dioxygenase family)
VHAGRALPRDVDLIWVETPFGEPQPRIVVGAARAGGFGVLDLGKDAARARDALAEVTRRTGAPFGVRVDARCPLGPGDLPAGVHTLVVADPGLVGAWAGDWRVVAEVRSADEARAALAAGVDGLVARGAESGGRVGTTGAFVLGQQVRALSDAPLWVQGGIGRHTAAAAVTGGATGVVLEAQVALLRESTLSRPIRLALAAMDGSETRVVAGHRVYTRPDLWVADADDRISANDLAPRVGATSLREQALPAGQDAALAAGFAARYGSVGALVSGLRREIAEHLDAARRVEPLAPGAGVAGTTGAAYPVVQGPMTRVSDRAAFAEAVAEGGGLPFLALALLRGESEVRPLLEETAARLGDRPWGVGVLGFVPKDLRDEQLAVIRDVRPPLALIAGGRPAQAVRLEEAGIRTFLHVPAPGLLERFLADRARRFVFEGFECGGHTGPRSSYALWEAQLGVIEGWRASGGDASELDVLFAGGIHDERSAAMVAALAGPLAAAGARIGVLMGTAYLFTEEVVAAGAIGEEFQAQALACERTALLESGPGHATRCAETPFVDLFAETRARLVSEGADPQVRWAELEGLNLGRLRVASKGLRRDGDELVTVGRDEQRAEGMFMIGDVATLRRERTTIAALHAAVTEGATAHVARVADDLAGLGATRAEPVPAPADVAIVGMACVMPGATDLDEFWRNIVAGVNSIGEVPPDRWDVERYFDPTWDHATATQRSGSASKWGGFLPDIAFDALAYGIPPASLAAIEPTQLLSLKVAADALADAGYAERSFDRQRASVIFGAEGGTDQSTAHGFRALYPSYLGQMPAELEEWLPKISEDSFPGLLTNVIAGRIANRLDLGGKNLTVDAACASSLAALDAACIELASGGSDLVLCGGADLHNGVQDFLLFTSVHALSTTGRCRTFDAGADGIALGEGVACVVLKRLADAERDGDRIYGIVRGVGASSDGRSLGLTAPRQDGQERAVRRAYAQARIEPREVGLIEAHGTGTVVGDRTELSTLTEVFTAAGMGPAACVVGSVKSNIGHTKCAAGLAGLVKAAKAVFHGVHPPTLHITRPNQAWDPGTSPFVFLDEARPWTAERRVAGISAFGFGGTNFHAVVESHPDGDVPDRSVEAWPAELFAFRGDEDGVARALDDLAVRLADPAPAGRPWRLRDIAAAVTFAGRGPVRLVIVADDVDDLRTKVAAAREGREGPGLYRPGEPLAPEGGAPPVTFLFPGQGSQRPGMATDLFVAFAETRPLLRLGHRWEAAMLPAAAFDDATRDAQRQAVTDTRVAQPALGLAGLATARVLDRFGVRPDMVAGHSYGELVALCAAGAFDDAALLELSEARGRAMVAAVPDGDPGGMVAVAAPRDRLDEVLVGVDVVVANDNHPDQQVIAGTTPAMDEAVGRLKDAGISAKRLPVACAFHSPVVAAAADALAEHLDGMEVTEPVLPVYSNLTADAYPADARKVRGLLAAQVANGVRFTEQVRAMYEAGARVFVEAGPGRTLTGCVERILGDRPHLAVAVDRPGDDGVRALLHALARLLVAGVPVDVAELFEGRGTDPARWADPPAAARWTVNGHLVREAGGDTVPGGLRPATTVPAVTAVPASTPALVPSNGNGHGGLPADQVLTEYFRTAHEIMAAGHQLVLNYLGVAPSTIPAPAPVIPAVEAPAAIAPVAAAVAPPAAPATGLPSGPELLARLTAIVSARTGYPEDMLGPDLDVEADLSIDSIKRLEILGELADAIGLSDDGSLDQLEDLVEELAARKTLRGIVGFLVEHEDRLGDTPAPAPVAAAAPVAALPSAEELLARLTAIVSARTGYPEDMLGPDLDVEADLSIDSIKRLEILGELADAIGLSDDGSLDQLEDLVEELAARKTLRSIVEFLIEHEDRLGGETPPPREAVAFPATAQRFVVALADAPLGEPDLVPGRAVRVTGEGPVADRLVEELGVRGVEAGAPDAGAGLVVMTDLLAEPLEAPELYRRLRPLLLDTAADLLVVTPLGGGLGVDPPAPRPDGGVLPVGAGARGLVKTAALEFPERAIRLVDVDPAAGEAEVARILADEVVRPAGPVEVGWRDGCRRAPVAMPAPVPAGPAAVPLTGESVVLVTGGARGITARVAVALARSAGCHLELVGRTALPEVDEDPALAGAADRGELRRALIATGLREPRAVERECDRVMAAREMRATVAALAAAGASYRYHQVDVRDRAALAEVVRAAYAERGRLDGVVHGAGALDDHAIADKPPERFVPVWSTKVDAARALLDGLREGLGAGHEAAAFVAFFGSIAGVCGNRGQVDYAAANDALDTLAASHADVARRVVALDWGPWAPGAGMVSPELARVFEEGGMGLIAAEDGVAVALEEIGAAAGPHQVVIARCTADWMAAGVRHGA